MAINTIDESQRKAARVVGSIYLLALVTGVFAEFYVRDSLIVFENAAETARNILANERLFRIGIAANLITFASSVVLITGLYVVLRPVNGNLALAAAFWRLVETAILFISVLTDLDVLRLLSGADYLRPLEANQLHALARLSVGAHGAAYQIGLLLFGLGSTLFCYLWFKSNYIPRPLAGWGVFSSLLVGMSVFAFIIFPNLGKILMPGVYAPIFFFELILGLWLLLKGLRPAGIS